ncbi:MAG: phosphoribosyltransferase domain-containing protein [Selenomonadaceae bacterium]|nr:phosphoribosyltransferase domain-containing protein [Selenomonadaceae bacterium]
MGLKMIYKINDVLRIAKRHNNNKRSYLLVNPLQGKHIPVSSTSALNMMKTLGDKVASKYPDTKLVIGFAETATAIGAMVAASLSEDCIYIHTTREQFSNNYHFIDFLEEHSHAPEQRLYCDKLNEWLQHTSTVVFVDDELSTGKTLRNIIRQLKSEYPIINNKKLVVVSIINRLSSENEDLLQSDGIDCEYLIKLPTRNFDVSDIITQAPKVLNSLTESIENKILFNMTTSLPNPRLGVQIQNYISGLKLLGSKILNLVEDSDSILVLGTEECMLPAIITGKILEDKGYKVLTHSSTRSPIGITQQNDYPITEGYQLRSFYDVNRITYIYNLKYYDLILVISDVGYWHTESVNSLLTALSVHGYGKVIFVGGNDVQHL